MAEFAALPLFTDAIIADAGYLTDQKFGAYMRLLMLTWRTPGCRIPNDDVWIAERLARPVEEVVAIHRPIINEFFSSNGNYLFQKRLFKEFKYLTSRSKKQSERAKSRWDKEKDVCRGSTASGNAPHPTPPTPTITPLSPFEASVSFEEFWRLFPVQTGRGFALPAYQKALSITTHVVIMAALKKQLPALAKQKFPAANPTKWLQGECWADMPPKGQDIDAACRAAIL